jgi:hypothetical protein
VLEELAVRVAGSGSRVASAELAAEFPSVFIRFGEDAGPPHLHVSDWERADFDTWSFDCAIDALASDSFTLRLECGDDASALRSFPLEVLTRCQRHVGRRNRHSRSSFFTRLLRHHRALHDLEKPLVRADYNHALDVWQWVLRLEPDASASVQIAALFHDIERLRSEADARAGAAMTDAVLAEAGANELLRVEVAELLMTREHEPGILSDADALSFFSLNSSGYAHYFGPEQTRKKVGSMWNRMSDRARARLATIRLRPEVRAMLGEVHVCTR